MYDIYPWWTSFYFVGLAFSFWLVFWAGLWSMGLIVKLSRKALGVGNKQR